MKIISKNGKWNLNYYSMFSSFNFVGYISIFFISLLTVFLEKLQENLVT